MTLLSQNYYRNLTIKIEYPDMVGYTYAEIPSDFSPLSEIRNLKIRLITEDVRFKVSENTFDRYESYLRFIGNQYPDSIITGSLALNLYSLINREIKDIDLIVDKRPTGSFHRDRYGDENIEFNSERIGYQYITEEFSWKRIFNKRQTFNVDFFLDENDKVKYNTFTFNKKTYKIQDPVQIIEQKLEMVNNAENRISPSMPHMYESKRKHNKDLYVFFKNFN
jgi:hypothetical protein